MRSTPIVRRVAPALLLAAAGCFGEFVPPAEDPGGSSSTGAASQDDSTTAMEAGESGDSTTSTTAPPDPVRLAPFPCHVDLLVVIDFSDRMTPISGELAETFFGVTSAFESVLNWVDSYNVGVTTNSVVPWNAAAFTPEGERPLDCTGPGSFTRPQSSHCHGVFDGNPYITEDTDLSEVPTCLMEGLLLSHPALDAANPVEVIQAAVSPELNAPGGCNAGFHVEDDPLIIVVITASDDDAGYNDVHVPAGPAADILKAVDKPKLALSIIAGPTCACDDGGTKGCGAECISGLQPQPPCSFLSLSDLLFAGTEGLEDHLIYTDICEDPGDGSNPFTATLAANLARQAALVCAAAAEDP